MDKPLTLSTAYATWVDGEKFWRVVDIKLNTLEKFSNKLSEREIMGVIKFGRKFEVEAFNIGIEFGKSEYKRMHDPEVLFLKEQISALEQMNISLSEKLEKFIIGPAEGEN
jgi:hypothetical protein